MSALPSKVRILSNLQIDGIKDKFMLRFKIITRFRAHAGIVDNLEGKVSAKQAVVRN